MGTEKSPPRSDVQDVVWPLGRHRTDPGAPAHRLDSLDGKVIGFVWDYMFKGDEAFRLISAELQKRYPAVEFVDFPVFGNIHGPEERDVIDKLPERLRAYSVDAVVVGVGH
jgi:hypothetical protein